MNGERAVPGALAELSAGQVEEVLGILEGYWDRLERGEQPSLEELAAKYPRYADLLRGHAGALDQLHHAAAGIDPDPSAAPDARVRGRLGDYRIIRQVGRGGMGVVYEAEQLSLGRRVALKVLPFAATLDARQLQRFKNEAQAAAQLHHSNIVPVFAVGCDRGVHYYAMQFIDGRTLAQLITDLRTPTPAGSPAGPATPRGPADPPTVVDRSTERSIRSAAFFRTVAQLGVQAALALEHAHQAGILHRDVKPGNLLVGEGGHLWVTDFGLARCRAEKGLTATGDLLGTLRYMSPEQALAKRDLVDHRSDIYSLGVTLYEALTLEPAYPGVDREELLRQIADGNPRPPRRLNRAIPVDLETVVLKAMAREPRDRYATAEELADDLKRFLEHRPVQARRPSLPERAARWAGRHKPLVAAAALMVLLAAVGLGVSTVVVWNQKEQTRAALDEARQLRRRVEANFETALRGTYDLLVKLEDPRLGDSPQLAALRDAQVAEGVSFLERFVHEDSPDPWIQFQSAQALGLIANIYCAHQKVEPSKAAMRRSIALLERLVAQAPAGRKYRLELFRRHNLMGLLSASAKHPRQAREGFTRAAAVLRAGLPYDADGKFANNLAWLLADCRVVSLRDPAEAVALARQAVARAPHDGRYWNTLGVALYRKGAYAEAGRALHKSMALRHGGDPADWFFLAMTYRRQGHPDQARTWYDRSVRWMVEHPPVDESLLRYRAEADELFRAAGK
jgi:serine/threonine protein kinase